MCGIVGYIGKKNALPIVIEGLKTLEYRGYDSAGVALWDDKTGKIRLEKAVGRVAALETRVSHKSWLGGMAIAHTRWATHGKPSERNAHPHTDCTESIFLVHNGIIENYSELKEALLREGHSFRSETDTEVLAHLVERPFLAGGNVILEDALLDALRHVYGTFGVAVISKDDPQKIVVARRGSPIILGVGEGEYLPAVGDVHCLTVNFKALLGKLRQRPIDLRLGAAADRDARSLARARPGSASGAATALHRSASSRPDSPPGASDVRPRPI